LTKQKDYVTLYLLLSQQFSYLQDWQLQMSNGARQSASHIKSPLFLPSRSEVNIDNWTLWADVPMINYKSHFVDKFNTLLMSAKTLT